MSKWIRILPTLFLLIGINEHAMAAKDCAPEHARLLGEAVALAHPYVDSEPLFDFVRENNTKFSATGGAIRCARQLARALMKSGTDSYDPKAYERVMKGGGPPDLAPKVAQDMNALSVDMVTFGMELAWLAEVLPPAAEGDTDPFETTATPTRELLRQNLPQIQLMLQISPPYMRAAFMQEIQQQQEATRRGVPLLARQLK